ncbi:hypothetical protein Ac2012v2_006000 [Leucoagaricus gongylophorus]
MLGMATVSVANVSRAQYPAPGFDYETQSRHSMRLLEWHYCDDSATCTTAGRRTFECSIACEKVEDWAVNGPLISRGSGTSGDRVGEEVVVD